MLDLQIQYDPNISISGQYVEQSTDIHNIVQLLTIERLPSNIGALMGTPNFKEAIVFNLLKNVDSSVQQKTVLELLSACVASIPDSSESAINTWCEVLASVAYSWGETNLATKAILRVNPELSDNHIRTIAVALNKKMEAPMFKSLLINTTQTAAADWEMEQLLNA